MAIAIMSPYVYFNIASLTAIKLRIRPSDITARVGEWAHVNCTIPCELELNGSHTFKWFVGDHRTRRVDSDFEQKTGIKVETEIVKECKDRSGEARHQLRVFISSAERLNRTAVQFAALRKGRAFTDLYSYFAMILVKGMIFTPCISNCYSYETITVTSGIMYNIIL